MFRTSIKLFDFVQVWDANLKFLRDIPIHKDFPVLVMCVNSHNQMYTCGRDGSLRYFRSPWRNNNNDIMLQTVMDDVTALYCVDNILYSGDDKGIVTKWYHNQVGCQYNVLEEVNCAQLIFQIIFDSKIIKFQCFRL